MRDYLRGGVAGRRRRGLPAVAACPAALWTVQGQFSDG
jgi:hypothetical protein